jgi:hypothetical protein
MVSNMFQSEQKKAQYIIIPGVNLDGVCGEVDGLS